MPDSRYAWLIQLFDSGEHVTHADATLQGRHEWFDALVKENALVHSGNASHLLCPQCDEPHDIAINPTTFKGYCVDAGHVSFEAKRIMQYQASAAWLIETLRKSLGISGTDKTTDIIANTCWKIGAARLEKKLRPIFLCRGYEQSKKAVNEAVNALADETGIILLTSPHQQNPEKISAHRAVAMTMCLSETPDKTLISADILRRMWNNQLTIDSPLTHSADYRTVTLNGITHHFPGDSQRAFVQHLIELYKKGEQSAKTSKVMSAIGVESTRRISNLFNGHQTWKDLIEYGKQKGSSNDLPRGICRLRIG